MQNENKHKQKTKKIVLCIAEILLIFMACTFCGFCGYKIYEQTDYDYIPGLGDVILLEPFIIDLLDSKPDGEYPIGFALIAEITLEDNCTALIVYDGYALSFQTADSNMKYFDGLFNITYLVIMSVEGLTIFYNNTFYEKLVFQNVINPHIAPIYFYRLVVE